MIAAHLTHLVARVALVVSPPAQAMRVVARVARVFPRLERDRASHVASALEGTGTCLTRAMSIAARLPNSTLVFGPSPEGIPFRGHAWVEMDGRPLRSWDATGPALARLTGAVEEMW